MTLRAPLLGKALTKPLVAILLLTSLASCSLKYKHRTKPRNYYTGFIITVDNDTIEGRVKLKNDYKNKVNFIRDNSKKREYIFPQEVDYMQITGLRFKNVILNGKERLLEQIAFGKYNLYGFVRSVPDRGNVHYYYIELEEGKELTRIHENNYRDIFRISVFQDPFIMQQVESGTWGYDDMLRIFRTYNSRNSD